MKEHDPRTCPACRKYGNWATTPDTEAWLEAHKKAGIGIKVVLTKRGSKVVCVDKK